MLCIIFLYQKRYHFCYNLGYLKGCCALICRIKKSNSGWISRSGVIYPVVVAHRGHSLDKVEKMQGSSSNLPSQKLNRRIYVWMTLNQKKTCWAFIPYIACVGLRVLWNATAWAKFVFQHWIQWDMYLVVWYLKGTPSNMPVDAVETLNWVKCSG